MGSPPGDLFNKALQGMSERGRETERERKRQRAREREGEDRESQR